MLLKDARRPNEEGVTISCCSAQLLSDVTAAGVPTLIAGESLTINEAQGLWVLTPNKDQILLCGGGIGPTGGPTAQGFAVP